MNQCNHIENMLNVTLQYIQRYLNRSISKLEYILLTLLLWDKVAPVYPGMLRNKANFIKSLPFSNCLFEIYI